MDTSTPVSHLKPTCCRYYSESHSEPLIEETNHPCPNQDSGDESVIITQTPYLVSEHVTEFCPTNQSTNLNKSEELFPFSPIPLRENIPPTLLPILDTPDLKFSSSILTQYSYRNENYTPPIPNNKDQAGNSCTKSFFETFQYLDNSNDSLSTNPQGSVEKANQTSPVLNSSLVSRTRKSSKNINKKLFSITEKGSRTDISHQYMGDFTMDAPERICQMSKSLYSDTAPRMSSEADCCDPVSVFQSLQTEATAEIGILSEENCIPPVAPRIDDNDIDFVFKTQFDFEDIKLHKDVFNRKQFVYPVNSVKLSNVVYPREVLESVLPLEINDRVCIKKSRLIPRELICFTQLSNANHSPDHPQLVLKKNQKVTSNSTAASVEARKFAYLIQVARENKEAYFSLKKFFEIVRVDFARLVSTSSSWHLMHEVLMIVSEKEVPKFLNNQEINNHLCQSLRVSRINRIRAMKQFVTFFNHNFHLLYNGYKIRRFFNVISACTNRKRKATEFNGDSRKKKLKRRLENQLLVDIPNSLIDFPDSDSTMDSQFELLLKRDTSSTRIYEPYNRKNFLNNVESFPSEQKRTPPVRPDVSLHINRVNNGYSGGSRQHTNVRAEPLDYCKRLLESISEDAFSDIPESTSPIFSSAGAKKIDIEQKSIKPAQMLMKVVEDAADSVGCSTVAGKQMPVNEEHLKRIQKMKNEDSNDTEENQTKTEVSYCKVLAFSSAGSKSITVQQKSLSRGRKIAENLREIKEQGVAVDEETVQIDGSLENIADDCDSSKFSFISSGAFKGPGTENTINTSVFALEKEHVGTKTYKFDRINDNPVEGFKLASGNSLKVSALALKRAENLFESILREDDLSTNLKPDNALKGFSTASGNSLKVSESTFRKTEQLFKSCDNDNSAFNLHFSSPKEFGWRSGYLSVDLQPLKTSQELFNDALSSPKNANFELSETKQIVDEVTNIDADLFSASDFSILIDQSETNADSTRNAATNLNLKVLKSASALQHNENVSVEKGNKQVVPVHSRPSSPVFETRKLSQQRKPRKRKTQSGTIISNLMPLNVTYNSKEEVHLVCENVSPEVMLQKFKDNFSHKTSKRKEPGSVLIYPRPKRVKDGEIECKSEVMQQQKYVKSKPYEDRRARDGWFSTLRKEKKIVAFREAVTIDKPNKCSVLELIRFGVKSSVAVIDSENAGKFKFSSEFFPCNYDGEIFYGDDCRVIPNEKNEAEFKDLARAFLASPAVDPKLITEQWIKNHYRWIVWKLASVEKSFPEQFGGRFLTVDHVLFQLKYRYDREIDKCHRSALKRILECDDAPSKAMVLCVSAIKHDEYELELTDGWYSIIGQIDHEMYKLVSKRKLFVGAKILVMNSELVGLNDACDPLLVSVHGTEKVDSNVRLKICTNSVRRVRWDTKLGFFNKISVPIVRDLKNILPKGGISFAVTAVISRVYPILYREKNEDGVFSEVYNEKIELKRAAEYEKKKQACYETIVSQVTKEVLGESNVDDMDYVDGADIENLEEYMARRRNARDEMNYTIRERIEQRLPENFRKRRNVSTLLKVHIVNDDDEYPPQTALLTIWDADEDVLTHIKEGRLCTFHHLKASDIRNDELCLSTTRMTQFDVQNTAPKNNRHFRVFTPFSDLNNDFISTFKEIDTVGVVISENNVNEHNAGCHTVFMADLDMNIIAIKFSSSSKNFGFEDILKRRRIVNGMNLQWRHGCNYWKIPVLIASESTTFLQKSKYRHLQDRLDVFEKFFKKEKMDSFVLNCEKKLKSIICSSAPVVSNIVYNINAAAAGASSPPVATSTPVKFMSTEKLNMTSTDNSNRTEFTYRSRHSPFDFPEVFNKSSSTKEVQSRIDRLRVYEEPPPLSPITMDTRPRRARLSVLTRSYNRM